MSCSIQSTGRVAESARELQVAGTYDLIVAGGGMAGFGAAVAAARRGCRTLLIERESALGGLATLGLVNIPLDLCRSLGREMLAKLDSLQAHWHRNTDPEKHKLVLDRMVTESGADLLLVSHVVDTIMSGNRVAGVVVESKSGREAFLAQRIIDCTGDADVAYFAGAECLSGRPEDGRHQACSLDFRLGGVDFDAYRNSELKRHDPSWLNVIKSALDHGDLPFMIENHLNWMTHVPGRPQHCGRDEVGICISHSRNCDPLSSRDLTRMYLEGREQAEIFSTFIRKYIPGFENSYLIDTAPLLGVRESRRIVGEYVLQTLDFARAAKFDDAIASTNHHFDLHNPDGPGNIKWARAVIDGKVCYISSNGNPGSWPPPCGDENLTDGWGRSGADRRFPDTPCDIPYRALVPLKVENLLAAGRCLSSDFMAQAASRLVLTCLNLGEAAGIAMVLSLRNQVAPRQINVRELQAELRAADAAVS